MWRERLGNLDEARTLYQTCLSLNWERQDLENVAWSLVGLAIIADSDGQLEEAARLMALADQCREITGAPLTPHIERDHQPGNRNNRWPYRIGAIRGDSGGRQGRRSRNRHRRSVGPDQGRSRIERLIRFQTWTNATRARDSEADGIRKVEPGNCRCALHQSWHRQGACDAYSGQARPALQVGGNGFCPPARAGLTSQLVYGICLLQLRS